ncbi:MAG: type IX secretion system sortase PorU [Ignavibacteria bacterium]|nr:type IX secretion system sortase PorU [Ignavibacteria bacterium]
MLKKISLSIVALFLTVFPQSDLRLVQSSPSSCIIEFIPDFTDTSVHLYGERLYREINFRGAGVLPNLKAGMPNMKSRVISLGIPFENGVTAEIISATFKYFDGELPPVAEISFNEDRNPVYTYVSRPGSTDLSENIIFGESGIIRGLNVQDIHIVPAIQEYGKIKVVTRIQVKFSFGGSSISSNVEDDLLRDMIINYDVAKRWITKAKPALKKGAGAGSTVLSSGKWVRFEAPEEGFYRITYDQLRNYGVDPATVNPKTIKIYNNGGYVLSENILMPRPEDLQEIAITVSGEDDGRFDPADNIIFYGRGTAFWYYDTLGRQMMRNQHSYSAKNYFWITSGGANGKRTGTKTAVTDPNPTVVETSNAYEFWDEDKINIGQSGRYFVGDEFSQSVKSRVYQKKVEGIVPGTPSYYRYWFVNRSTDRISLTIEENGNLVRQSSMTGIGSDPYSYGRMDSSRSVTHFGTYPDERSVLRFTFGALNSTSYGYLDFYEITYTRYLKAYNDILLFYSPKVSGTTGPDSLYEYRLNNFSNTDIKVYDITDHSAVKLVTNPVMQSGSEYRFRVYEKPNFVSRYYAFCGNQYKTPVNTVEVANQNIRGDLSGAKLILVTSKDFQESANRYKQHRESNTNDPLSVKIFFVEEIMNEFNGGSLDPSALRDFIKYAYDNWQITPDYVFLWGDGDYDFKNIEGKNKNFVLTYQTREFLQEIEAYPTDDFFACVSGTDRKVDIAIGRIAIQSQKQANDYLNKLIAYEKTTDKNAWKNLITLVADDNLTSQGIDLARNTEQSERLSQTVIPREYDQKKIYLINYPTVQTSLGRRKPEVNAAIINSINEGSVLLNYIGHGSPELWAHEQVFVKSSTIPQLKNSRYFFLTAATCDFGYYDKTDAQSATEDLLFLPNAGAIGVFTAVRPVFSEQNTILNDDFYSQILSTQRDSDNLPRRIGTAYLTTKMRYTSSNDQKFHLFCDPALRLALPQFSGKVDSINGIDPFVQTIPVKALNNIKIAGTVKKADGTNWSDFNGEGLLTVYDAETTLPLPEIGPNVSMKVPGGLIFRGRVSVLNGKFNTDFVVPKDISYDNQKGKIVFYFFNSEKDGIAFTNNVSIGGVDQSVINDGKGPVIDITFDDAQYENAYLVNPNSTLVVSLKDETGLNTTGLGVGHKLEAVLNEKEENPIDLTNYFTGDLNSGGKSGKVNYKFVSLEPGIYNIRIKGWDVFNNASTAETEFKVVSGNGTAVEYVMNYPNPFSSNTFFTFQHNIAGTVDVRILIYTVAGRKIKEIDSKWVNDRFVRIEWDGRDQDGDLAGNGTYLYKLIVKPSNGGETKTVLGKLSIVR